MLKYTALLVLFAGGVWAQVLRFGDCPSVTVKPRFNIARYMGKWYEMQRFFAIFELAESCVTANYTLRSDNSVKVVNRAYTYFFGYKEEDGDAVVPDASEPAKLFVRFDKRMSKGTNYWILETDYENYSVVWSCAKLSTWIPFNTQFAWILTREQRGISDSMITGIYRRLRQAGVNPSHFRTTNQNNCS